MYDVAVIGSSIARELSRHRLSVVVLERGTDVAVGTSKANSGIVHAGYDAKPGTQKARYNVAGQALFEELSGELDFPFRRCGSLVITFEEEGIAKLEDLKCQGEHNGVRGTSVVGRERLLEMEPHIGDGVLAALDVPTGGIVCPYEMTIAFAENAVTNGVEFRFLTEVERVAKTAGGFVLDTGSGLVDAKVVVNAAGFHADAINNMVSRESITIVPRRGEYCLLDKTEGDLVSRTIFQLPGKMGKGVLVTPTADGNIMVGPTSVDMDDKEDMGTTPEGLAEALEKGSRYVNRLDRSKIITSFSGLRAHSTADDFIVGEAPDVPGFINCAGIESPGLTSAPAIARAVEEMVVELLHPQPNPGFRPRRRAAPRFRHLDTEARKALVDADPDYGRIVCRCETVTKTGILAALRSPLGVRDLDAIKRLTRAGLGRCQGAFCNMRLVGIVAEELEIPLTEVTKNGPGNNLLVEKNKSRL